MPLESWQELTRRVEALESRFARFERIGWAALGLLVGSGTLNGIAFLKALGE